MRNSRIAQRLAKKALGFADDCQLGIHYNGGPLLRKDFWGSIRSAFGNQQGQEQPFSGSFWGNKYAYNPSFGSVPDGLQPQVTRALDRDEELPDQIQSQLNTTTERVKGTTDVVPDDSASEPVGYGGSGDTGVKSYQLGHASTAGQSNVVAAPPAPELAPSTTPSVNVAGSIAPSIAPPPAPAPSGNQAVAPALRAPTAPSMPSA